MLGLGDESTLPGISDGLTGFGLFRSSKAHVVGDTYPIQSMYGIRTARLLRLPQLRNRLGNGRRNPKPIPKFKTLNVECNSLFWYLWQVFWDLGQTKAPAGIFTGYLRLIFMVNVGRNILYMDVIGRLWI